MSMSKRCPQSFKKLCATLGTILSIYCLPFWINCVCMNALNARRLHEAFSSIALVSWWASLHQAVEMHSLQTRTVLHEYDVYMFIFWSMQIDPFAPSVKGGIQPLRLPPIVLAEFTSCLQPWHDIVGDHCLRRENAKINGEPLLLHTVLVSRWSHSQWHWTSCNRVVNVIDWSWCP